MDRRGFLGGIGSIALTGVSSERIHAHEGSSEIWLTSGVPDRPKVKAMGVGGAGGSILDQMIASNVLGIDEFIYVNTDNYGHDVSAASHKIILGTGEWQPAVSAARLAWSERHRIIAAIADTDILLLIAGMGGIAGTALAPVIAKLAHENGALTVALLVTPFSFEGKRQLVAGRRVLVMQTIADWTRVQSNEAYAHAVPGGTTRLQRFRMVSNAIIDDARAVLSVVGGSYRRHQTTPFANGQPQRQVKPMA
jgi:cell division protein FtsZ